MTPDDQEAPNTGWPPSVDWPLWFVVRRAELSFAEAADVPVPLKTVGSLLYQGLDRMPWWDLDDLYHNGAFPPNRLPLYRSTTRVKGPGDLRSAKSLEDALVLLQTTPEVALNNEVVCAAGADCGHQWADLQVNWLGYDPVYKSATAFTLLEQVFLHRCGPMAAGASKLNSHGLFETASQAREFGAWYRELALENKVEPLPLFDECFEVLAVGRPTPEAVQASDAGHR